MVYPLNNTQIQELNNIIEEIKSLCSNCQRRLTEYNNSIDVNNHLVPDVTTKLRLLQTRIQEYENPRRIISSRKTS